MLDNFTTAEIIIIATFVLGFLLTKVEVLLATIFTPVFMWIGGRVKIEETQSPDSFMNLSKLVSGKLKNRNSFACINEKITMFPKRYFLKIDGKFCYADFSERELNNGGIHREITLYILFVGPTYIKKFINDVLLKKNLLLDGEYGVCRVKRDFIEEQVVHKLFIKKELIHKKHYKTISTATEKMVADEEIHKSSSFLLHGFTGSGKSTLASYLAKEHQIPIFNVRGLDKYNTPIDLIDTICWRNETKAIVLIEECDVMIDNKNISLFLNALDGVSPIQNKIIIMTTNYINKIDSRLIRDGRMQALEFTEKDAKKILDKK